MLDGGAGYDFASYSDATGSVSIDLGLVGQVGGDAEDDILISIEGVIGSAFNDTLIGDGWNNYLTGQAGSDTLAGADGNDELHGSSGNDSLDGGAGNDKLLGEDGNDSVSGGDGGDLLNGGAGLDSLDGGAGNDGFYGGGGNDLLFGRDGNDNLFGDGGADRLDGGTGNDGLTGGANGDTFAFSGNIGLDVIQDFKDTATENDFIEFSLSLFANTDAVLAAMAQVGADVVITYDATNTITIKGASVANFAAEDFIFV